MSSIFRAHSACQARLESLRSGTQSDPCIFSVGNDPLAERRIPAMDAAANDGVTRSQECLKCITRYAHIATIAMVKAETVSVGIQNKNTLKSLFPSRLAAKNNAKSKIAGIQNRGENKFSTSPPTTAASPVARVLLMPLRNHKEPTISARIIAASPLRMPLK